MLAKYMQNVKIRMYLYIVDAEGLQPKLLNSNPNPFIVVKFGDRLISVYLLLYSSKSKLIKRLIILTLSSL